MKSVFLWLQKAFIAGVLALVVLCIFSLFYDNKPPGVSIKNELNEFPEQPNYFYCYMVEGFGYGKTDKNGYLNLPEAAESATCDVLIMGSSHMVAMHVPQSITAASILNANLNNLNVYNIALSNRYFLYNCTNLQYALENKRPKYVAIEITSVDLDNNAIELALANELPNKSPWDFSMKRYLQKIQYLRLMHHQYEGLKGARANELSKSSDIVSTPPLSDSSSVLPQLLDEISSIANKNGTRIIIFYHCPLQINEDGSATPQEDPDIVKNFATACNKVDITFIDMTETFLKAYNDSYILPHGFFNSSIGRGHLNAHGHKMIADELTKVILDMEGEN